MESLILGLFLAQLIACLALGIDLLWALAVGYVLFWGYGVFRGHGPLGVVKMSLGGIGKVKNVLITFIFIGMLTATWRASGTLAAIICYAARAIRPDIFLLLTFLLNCGVSFLTGTAFGTAATMGMVCMTMANAMGLSPVLTGGAILAGSFFGDRCSPVSTSALLVSEVTGTDLFRNLKNMMKSCAVPFVLSCGVYLAAGFLRPAQETALDILSLFSAAFAIHPAALIPAGVILGLSAARVNVKRSIAASAAAAAVLCLALQGMTPAALLRCLVLGFHTADPALEAMLGGGGIVSMVRVGAIVCLSSSYAGIFEGTGLLIGVQSAIARLGRRTFPFLATVLTAALTSMVACNQTLAIMLTQQLCGELEPDKETFALDLEDSVVVISPLVPWSIASAVPLATVGAPTAAVAAACYLYFLPLWRLFRRGRKQA